MSTGSLRLSFILDAVDRASAKVRQVAAGVDRLTAPVKRVRASVNDLLHSWKTERMQTSVATLRDRLGMLGGVLQSIAGLFVLVGGAAAGTFFAFKRVADEVDQINDSAVQLGITTQRFQELGFAAQMSGSSQDEMAQSLTLLSNNMVEAINGSKEMQLWFSRAGITMEELSTMKVDQVLARIADKYQAVGDAGQNAEKKVAMSKALLGRSGARLNQLLNQGSEGLRGYAAEARRLGVVLDGRTIKSMTEFNDTFDRAKLVVFGALASALSAVAPQLQTLIESFVKWTAENRGLIAMRVEMIFARISEVLPVLIDRAVEVAGAIGDIVAIVDAVVQAFGGWDVALNAIAVLLTVKLAVALASTTTALYGVAAAFLATPLGWVTALAAGAVLVYTQWEPIKKFFAELWEGAGRVIDRVSGFFGGGSTGGSSGSWEAPAAARPAPNAIVARGGPYRDGLGGTLRIQIDADGKPRVKDLSKKAGSPLELDVYTGRQMVTQ